MAMATKSAWRQVFRTGRLQPITKRLPISLSFSTRASQESSTTQPQAHDKYTGFGYETVKEDEKASKGVFLMNLAS
jgi:hypothetical protein